MVGENVTALHPAMQAFVAHMKAAGLPPDFRAVGVAAARQLGAGAAAAFGAGPVMQSVEDRTIDVAGGTIRARCYRPEGNVLGLIVYFHGGGWTIGDIEGYDSLCRMLAVSAACVVVSVDYRLAPEHVFPAAVEDCYSSLLWADVYLAGLNGVPRRLIVAGDSAGGNLAAVSAILARDRAGPAIAL